MSLNGTGTRSSTVKVGRSPAANPLRVGATTQRFFEEGEQHEAAEWTDTVLPPDDAPEKDPETQFESFDKIPKKRSPAITIAAIGACLLVGVAAWTMAFGILRRGHSVQDSARAMTGAAAPAPAPSNTVSAAGPADVPTADPVNAGTVTPAPGTVPTTTAPEGGDTAPGTAPAAGPLVVPMAPNSPTTPAPIAGPKAAGGLTLAPRAGRRPATSVIEIASTAPAAGGIGSPNTLATDTGAPRGLGTETRSLGGQSEATGLAPGGSAPGSSETSGAAANVKPSRAPEEGATDRSGSGVSTETRDDRAPPLRGYVWSPSAKALVPADRSLPTTDPDFARVPTPALSTSSNVSPGTAPRVALPTTPTSSLGDGNSRGAAVAPATTGTAPPERPAAVGSGAQIAPPAFSPR